MTSTLNSFLLASNNFRPRVFSLSDIKDDSPHSSDDEKQTFYAGGEKSGTAVQGGGKKNSNDFNEAHDIMSKIFANASTEAPSKDQKSNQFSGPGKKLSGSISPKLAAAEKEAEPEIVPVDLIFWNDGFTLNQGPVRPFDDPEGLRLLDNIRSGNISAADLGIGSYELADIKITQVPNEKFSEVRRSQIRNMTDQKGEPEAKKSAFIGNGEKIGDVNSEIVLVNNSAELDPSINITRIQVILPSGARKVITIAARAKIDELYAAVKKETNMSEFTLKVGNPAKTIPEDLDAFIYQVGLLNSSIILSK